MKNQNMYKKIISIAVLTFVLLTFAIFDNFVIPQIEIAGERNASLAINVTDSDFESKAVRSDKKSVKSAEDKETSLINSAGLFNGEIERIEKSLDVMEESIDSIGIGVDVIYDGTDGGLDIGRKDEKKINKEELEEIKNSIRKQSKNLLILIKEKNKESAFGFEEGDDEKSDVNNEDNKKTQSDYEHRKTKSDDKRKVKTNKIKKDEKEYVYDEQSDLDYFADYNIADLDSEFEGVFNDLFNIEEKTAREIIELEKIAIKKKKVEKRVEVQNESILSILRDSDMDGISDYDEINIYGTDPNSMDSDNDGYFDGVEIITGFNPVDGSNSVVEYENPKESEIMPNDEILSVEEIKIISDECVGEDCVDKKVEFRGKALPNSFITLYIFSVPIVVTVKTGSDGSWNYVLDQELEDGEHEVYVAMTDSFGKIVTKNSPTSFDKQAAAITVGETLASAVVEDKTPSFFNDSFMFISLIIILLAIGVMLVFSGGMKSNGDSGTDSTSIS